MLMIALPTMTRGCRARLERRVGISTLSGSRTARGLRGVMRLLSGTFGVIGAGPLAARSDDGGYRSPAPCAALGPGLASGSGPRTDEDENGAAGGRGGTAGRAGGR